MSDLEDDADDIITPEELADMKKTHEVFKAMMDNATAALEAGNDELFFIEMMMFAKAISTAGNAFNKAMSEGRAENSN